MKREVIPQHDPRPAKIVRKKNEIIRLMDRLYLILKESRKPASVATYGAEIEYCYDHKDYDARAAFNFLLRHKLSAVIKLHQDYAAIYEFSLPPFSLPPRPIDLQIAYYAEELSTLIGARVHHCITPDDDRSASQHFHIAHKNLTVMARMANWMIALIPVIKYVASMPVKVRTIGPYVGDDQSEYYRFVYSYREGDAGQFREMITHYTKKPYYISAATLEELSRVDWSTRGYDPEQANRFYAIEPNKYRKGVLTVENRLTENHILSSLFIAEIVKILAEKYPPPLVDTRKIYDYYIAGQPIYSSSTVEYDMIKEHPLLQKHRYRYSIAELLGIIRDTVYDELSTISQTIFDKLMKKRLTYFHYRRILLDYINTL